MSQSTRVPKDLESLGAPNLIETVADTNLGGGFKNPQITLPDTTCEVSGSEAITYLIRTSAYLNLGGGFEMVLHKLCGDANCARSNLLSDVYSIVRECQIP